MGGLVVNDICGHYSIVLAKFGDIKCKCSVFRIIHNFFMQNVGAVFVVQMSFVIRRLCQAEDKLHCTAAHLILYFNKAANLLLI